MLGADMLGVMILGQNTKLTVTLPEWRIQCAVETPWSKLYIRGTVTVECDKFAGDDAPTTEE